MPCGRTCRNATIRANTITLAMRRGGRVLDPRLHDAEHERGDHGALDLADAADDHHEEGVDDVVGAQVRRDRAHQGQRDAGDAGQARADEEREPVRAPGWRCRRSRRAARFCTVARMRRPSEVNLQAGGQRGERRDRQRQDEQPRLAGRRTRGPRRGPTARPGRARPRPRCRTRRGPAAAAPARRPRSPAACRAAGGTCGAAASPRAARRAGRRRRTRPAATRAATARRCRGSAGDEGGVGAGHDELAVRHVDDAHLAERERQAERGQQQDRPHAQPVEHLGDQDSHARPFGPGEAPGRRGRPAPPGGRTGDRRAGRVRRSS